MTPQSLKKSQILKPKKVLVLGSGSLKIGEAGEFDYSGTQAIKALKEEGIKTVLVNPNIATIQTSKELADRVYLLPVDPYFVTKVIEREKPDSILLSFGGQTALNCGVALWQQGVLQKHNIQVLGTPVEAIVDTEDRERFVKVLDGIGVLTPTSIATTSPREAMKAASKLGYPVIVRAAFTLGGQGSGIAQDKKEMEVLANRAFNFTKQLLVEECLKGWKEVEYEVVRDKYDNCITVCNMENMDPLGIHTGESIVVAPSQTLSNREYHMLREIAIRTIRRIGIVGECNIQFALDPKSEEYRVIEVNARLSRSSALASKATGYPLAFVAAKLSLGYSLLDLKNRVTQKTADCFEPALDYVVVKIPRWDLRKFDRVSKNLGSAMKSVGEVMAIGRTFEEAIQKAVRMLEIGAFGITGNAIDSKKILNDLAEPTEERFLLLAPALKKGITVEKIAAVTGMDPWFLSKVAHCVEIDSALSKTTLTSLPKELMKTAKQNGFSDKQIAYCLKSTEQEVRHLRQAWKVVPVVKQIDTLAAEYPAKTNYLYLTYNGTENDISPNRQKGIMVLGSGTYRIGSSVEFDWCCVNTVKSLKELGHQTVMVNCNPETVSTDYDICDRLYFEELSVERVLDIYEIEEANGVIVSMGGQTPNTIALKLKNVGVKIIGTDPDRIDACEDRHKFSKTLDKLKIDQPEWKECSNLRKAQAFAEEVGYPVLVRPSYVLSGSAMHVVHYPKDLKRFIKAATDISTEHPVVISKFIQNAREIEIDAVAHNGKLEIYAITEHVENAGVHSGDATVVLPPQFTYLETIRRVKAITKAIAAEYKITGPFNIQFLARENAIRVIECNLRASRSFPFVSKVTGYNFIDLATRAMMGKSIKGNYQTIDLDHIGVKAPQFSFSRLTGADPVLRVEMASTGEVACLGNTLEEAFLKSILATGFKMPKKNILMSIGKDTNKAKLLQAAETFVRLGFTLFATPGTSAFLKSNGVKNEIVYKISDKKHPNVEDYLHDRKFDLIINIPTSYSHDEISAGYVIRRGAVDSNITLLTNVQLVQLLARTLEKTSVDQLEIKEYSEYFE